MSAVIEALASANIPSAAAGTPLMQSFCVGETLYVAAERMGYLATGVQSAIAHDAPRILRVLLEARLRELSENPNGSASVLQFSVGSPSTMSVSDAIRGVLDVLAPEVP